jgi:hypothetical protein
MPKQELTMEEYQMLVKVGASPEDSNVIDEETGFYEPGATMWLSTIGLRDHGHSELGTIVPVEYLTEGTKLLNRWGLYSMNSGRELRDGESIGGESSAMSMSFYTLTLQEDTGILLLELIGTKLTKACAGCGCDMEDGHEERH